MSLKVKEEAKSLIDQLDDAHVKEMLDFMLWLKDRKEWEATYELMSIKGADEAYKEGLSAVEKGERVALNQIEN